MRSHPAIRIIYDIIFSILLFQILIWFSTDAPFSLWMRFFGIITSQLAFLLSLHSLIRSLLILENDRRRKHE